MQPNQPSSQKENTRGICLIRGALIPLLLLCTMVQAAIEPPVKPILRLNLAGHSAQITQLEVTPDGSKILTVSVDKTLKIWDAATLRLIRTVRIPIADGYEGSLYASAVSPDGKTVAISGFTGFTFEQTVSVYLVNIESGKIEGRIPGFDEVVTNLRFSLDGAKLYVALSRNLGFRIADVGTRKIIVEDRQYGGNTIGIEHVGQTGVATSSHDGKIRFYNPQGQVFDTIEFEPGTLPTAIRVNRSGELMAVGFMNEPRVAIVNLSAGNTISNLDISCFSDQVNTPRVFWSADSNSLFSYGNFEGDGGAPLYRWSVSGQTVSDCQKIPTSRRNLSDIDLLPNNELAFATTDPSIGVLSLDSMTERSTGADVVDFRNASPEINVSARADRVVFPVNSSGELWQFDFFGKSLTKAPPNSAADPEYSRNARHDNASINVQLPSGDVTVNGNRLPVETYEVINDFVVYKNKMVAAATEFGVVLSLDGNIVARSITPSHVETITISADQQTLVAALADGTIKWLDANDLTIYFTLYPDFGKQAIEPEWVGWTVDGYYISSNYGDSLIGWHFNNRIDEAANFYTALQYERLLYRPDLVRQSFEFNGKSRQGQQRTDATLQLRTISPGDLSVEILEASNDSALIKIDAKKRNLDHADIAVFVNNIPVLSRGERILSSQEASLVSRTLEIPMFAKSNSIRVELSNGKSMALAEQQVEQEHAPGKHRKGNLFVVAIGVNEFTEADDNTLPDLRYAANDASAFLLNLVENSSSLYNKVHYREVSDFSSILPTKSNIESTLELLGEATAHDTVIIFLASHGISDAAGNYFFVPRDVKAEDVDKLIDTGIAGDSLIGWESFLQAMRNSAGKRLLIVDTCYARSIAGPQDTHSLAKRSASASFGLLAAAQGNEESQENPELRHGLFTWSLIQAMKEGSDNNNDNVKSLAEIYQFIVPTVERLREKSMPQTPQLIALPVLLNMVVAN